MFKDTSSTPLAAVTVNCLLSKNENLTTVGAALASNIARFKVTCMFSTIHSTRVQYFDKASSDTTKRPLGFFIHKNMVIGDLYSVPVALISSLDYQNVWILKVTPFFQRIQIINILKFQSIIYKIGE